MGLLFTSVIMINILHGMEIAEVY